MTTLGFSDLKSNVVPGLWDLAEITKVRLADGTTFDAMVADVQAALALVNSEVLADPWVSGLIAVQDTVEVEYPVGNTSGIQESSEYSRPDPKPGSTTGHSIPLKPYDRALGWTMMFLRNARRGRLDADIRGVVTDIRNDVPQRILQRFFRSTAEKVGSTAGASVPFADGGTADPNYVPLRSPDGETFASTHNHFLRQAAVNDANVEAAIAHLQEHGHTAPYRIMGSIADISTWKGLTGWKAPNWNEVVYRDMSSGTDRAAISDLSEAFGFLETAYGIAYVKLTQRIPTAYYGAYKSYGPLDPRNPLRVRINPNWGFGWQLVPGNWINAPLLMAVAYTEWGVGVGEDRTNGVAVEIDASGDYATPTIS